MHDKSSNGDTSSFDPLIFFNKRVKWNFSHVKEQDDIFHMFIYIHILTCYRSGQNNRFASEPKKGLTSLIEPPKGPGFGCRADL